MGGGREAPSSRRLSAATALHCPNPCLPGRPPAAAVRSPVTWTSPFRRPAGLLPETPPARCRPVFPRLPLVSSRVSPGRHRGAQRLGGAGRSSLASQRGPSCPPPAAVRVSLRGAPGPWAVAPGGRVAGHTSSVPAPGPRAHSRFQRPHGDCLRGDAAGGRNLETGTEGPRSRRRRASRPTNGSGCHVRAACRSCDRAPPPSRDGRPAPAGPALGPEPAAGAGAALPGGQG